MSYKAVVVCTDPNAGVLFAKRADSIREAYAILGEEILRLCDDFDTSVVISTETDSYDESVVRAVFDNDNSVLEYKVCHEKDDEEE